MEDPTPRAPSRSVVVAALALLAPSVAGETNLQLTQPLLWALIAISSAGAIVTFSFLVYALWRFRDPTARRRRYG
ncbi:MAG: hypothetical protein WBG19_04095 [Thermoplasmata archaeon]